MSKFSVLENDIGISSVTMETIESAIQECGATTHMLASLAFAGLPFTLILLKLIRKAMHLSISLNGLDIALKNTSIMEGFHRRQPQTMKSFSLSRLFSLQKNPKMHSNAYCLRQIARSHHWGGRFLQDKALKSSISPIKMVIF